MKYCKKVYLFSFIILLTLSSFTLLMRSSLPPTGYTGANGNYCTSCHSSFTLNSGGGAVSISGIPSEYTPGTTYTFSLTISHGSANRKRWGFSIAARNSNNQSTGSFSGTNANAGANGNEYSHSPAVTTTNAATYTYTNLKWTAPANPTAADQNITFYFAGVAADGTGGSGSDYVHSGTFTTSPLALSTTYTFIGNGNWSNPANWQNGQIPPAILTGTDAIVINPAGAGECILDVSQTVNIGTSFTVVTGKNLRILGNLSINNE
ncbi:MAG: hypothetical protein RLY16_217 [Bacteroidota bacterium]|jgi:hypothetical protein